MTESGLNYLSKSGGWEIGTGPSLVIVGETFAKSMTSTTLTQDVYAYIRSEGPDGRHRHSGLQDHAHQSAEVTRGSPTGAGRRRALAGTDAPGPLVDATGGRNRGSEPDHVTTTVSTAGKRP